jgi:hypothetical protein
MKQLFKQNKMKNLNNTFNSRKKTNLFIVLDDVTLNTMKGKNNKTAKFATHDAANWAAAGKLNLWTVIQVAFVDKFIQHTI